MRGRKGPGGAQVTRKGGEQRSVGVLRAQGPGVRTRAQLLTRDELLKAGPLTNFAALPPSALTPAAPASVTTRSPHPSRCTMLIPDDRSPRPPKEALALRVREDFPAPLGRGDGEVRTMKHQV